MFHTENGQSLSSLLQHFPAILPWLCLCSPKFRFMLWSAQPVTLLAHTLPATYRSSLLTWPSWVSYIKHWCDLSSQPAGLIQALLVSEFTALYLLWRGVAGGKDGIISLQCHKPLQIFLMRGNTMEQTSTVGHRSMLLNSSGVFVGGGKGGIKNKFRSMRWKKGYHKKFRWMLSINQGLFWFLEAEVSAERTAKCLVVSQNPRKVCHRLSSSASFPNLSPSLNPSNPLKSCHPSISLPVLLPPALSLTLLPLHICPCVSLDAVL